MLDPNDITYAVLVAGAFCIILIIGCAVFNEHLPIWFCTRMGWHVRPNEIGFDGCSFNGVCPRCGKKVLQDSQGNWF